MTVFSTVSTNSLLERDFCIIDDPRLQDLVKAVIDKLDDLSSIYLFSLSYSLGVLKSEYGKF